MRPGLEDCFRLEAVADADRPAIAANPNWHEMLTAAGVVGEDHLRMIEQAAGDYARRTQAIERSAGMQRDVEAAGVNRDVCELHAELVDVVRRNNQQPDH